MLTNNIIIIKNSFSIAASTFFLTFVEEKGKETSKILDGAKENDYANVRTKKTLGEKLVRSTATRISHG